MNKFLQLDGKNVLITGSSRSIGKEIALRFSQEGANVVINYLNHKEEAFMIVDQIKKNGGNALAIKADVSNEREVKEMVLQAVDHFGSIDVLINNAAIDPRKEWDKITIDEWDSVMAVNVRSQYICCREIVPIMKKNNWGRIINVSSITFWTGQKNYIHYVASKGAIVGFTRAMARELGAAEITVNCISLGAILTETEIEKVGSQKAQGEISENIIELQSIPSRLRGESITGAFVFFSSDDCRYITGQTLMVDGGWIFN